ncbi:hypothetical protein C8F04DRAFT_967142, partial [Mycena alexandri]
LPFKKGPDINLASKGYGSAFGSTSYTGEMKIVCFLLEKGANVNLPGGEYGSPLGCAACGGYVAIVRLLLETGADIKTHGSVAMKVAKEKGRDKIALLKDRGAV